MKIINIKSTTPKKPVVRLGSLILALLFLFTFQTNASPGKGTGTGDVSWMKKGRYGIFMHYQYRILLGYSSGTSTSGHKASIARYISYDG